MKKYKCKHCEYQTNSERSFLLHMRTIHSKEYAKENYLLLCPICKKYCSSDLTQHITKTHKMSSDDFKSKYNMKLISHNVSSKRANSKHSRMKTIQCKECSELFETDNAYYLHCKKEHTHIIYNEKNKNEWIECKICGFRSPNISHHLKKHNISSKEYKQKYPNSPLHSKKMIKNTKNTGRSDNFVKTMKKYITDGFFDLEKYKQNEKGHIRILRNHCNNTLKVPIKGYAKCPICHYSNKERADLAQHFVDNDDKEHNEWLQINILDLEKEGKSRLEIEKIVKFPITKILKKYNLWKTMSEARPIAWINPEQCKHCNKIISSVGMRSHLYKFHKECYSWIKCPLCDEHFLDQKGLNDHIGLKKDELHQEYVKENYEKMILEKYSGIENQDYVECKHPDCKNKLIRGFNIEPHIRKVHKMNPWEYKQKFKNRTHIGRKSHKMGILCIAKDGHNCSSLGEKLIDDWLCDNKIYHEPHKLIGFKMMRCDQYIEYQNKKYYIECDGIGLGRRNKEFFQKIKWYRKLYSKGLIDGFLIIDSLNFKENLEELLFSKFDVNQYTFFKKDLKSLIYAKRINIVNFLFNHYKNNGFPNIFESQVKLSSEIKRIKNLSKKPLKEIVKNTSIGNFNRSHFIKSFTSNIKKSFHNDFNLKQVLLNRLGFNENLNNFPEFFNFHDKMLIQGFKSMRLCKPMSTYNPLIASYVIHQTKAKSWYDFSMGWGERLQAAISLNCKYFGIDLNKKLVNELKEMANYHNFKCNLKIGNSKNINFKGLKVDLVFSCPPYYDLEKYENEEMYNSYENWLEDYWLNTVKVSLKYLKKEGFFVFHIGKKYFKDMNEVCNNLGLMLIKLENIENKYSHFLKKKKSNSRKNEIIAFYKKSK